MAIRCIFGWLKSGPFGIVIFALDSGHREKNNDELGLYQSVGVGHQAVFAGFG